MTTARFSRTGGSFACLLALAALIVLVAPQPAAAADLVALSGGDKRVLPADSMGTVVFPIDFTSTGAKAAITPTVTDVLFDNASQPTAGIKPTLDTAQQQLRLTVTDPAQFARAGDYTAVVLLAAPPDNRQRLSLTLIRAAASLAAGGTVQIEHFTGPLSSVNQDNFPPVVLSVDGGGDLLSLSARQIDRGAGQIHLTAPCGAGTCQLDAGPPVALPAPLGVDGSLRLGYQLADFPLGTTTRTVELRSPQLAAPVTLTFTVTRRLSPYLIPAVALVGLFAGFAVRVLLTGAIAWSQRRRLRLQLQEIIKGIKRRYSNDAALLAELGSIEDVMKSRRISREVIDQQQLATAETLERANARLQELRTQNEETAALLRGSWTLPASLADSLDALKESLEATRKAIQNRHTDEALGKAAETASSVSNLSEAALDWLSGYRRALDHAIGALPQSPMSWPVSNLQAVLSQAKERATNPAAGDLTATLKTVDALIEDWQRDVEPAVRAVTDQFAANDPHLAGEVRSALREADATTRLDKAADPLGQLIVAPPLQQPQPPGTVHQESERIPGEAAPAGTATEVVLPAYDLPLRQRLATAPGRAFVLVVGALAEFARYLALATIACLAAYWVGAGSWVGTREQVMAVFAWAFALDLSVQAVSALFGGGGTNLPKLTTPEPVR